MGTGGVLDTFARSRAAMAPRDVKERGSAGAETLRSVISEAAFRRPRAAAAVPRVQRHRQRASGPTRRLSGRRAVVVQDLWRLRSRDAGAPLREGRPCNVLPPMHGLDRRPRNLRRAILATTLRTESNAASTGHRPCPATVAQACRVPRGQGWREYGGSAECGDKIVAKSLRPLKRNVQGCRRCGGGGGGGAPDPRRALISRSMRR